MQETIKSEWEAPRIPELDSEMGPLMPCHPARARKFLKEGKASAYRDKPGVFCIVLHTNVEPNNQPLALGIDPGSKFEGWSVIGSKSTVLNGMSEAATWIKRNVETRKEMRKARRGRNCPPRQCRSDNRTKSELPPSTKSRWQAKLNIVRHLMSILPIAAVVTEDVRAETKKNGKTESPTWSGLLSGRRFDCSDGSFTTIHWRARLLPTLSGGVSAAHD